MTLLTSQAVLATLSPLHPYPFNPNHDANAESASRVQRAGPVQRQRDAHASGAPLQTCSTLPQQ